MTKREEGLEFGRGLAKALAEVVMLGLVLLAAFRCAENMFGLRLDDSDFGGWNRSGLKVHTDARTGIQYLSDGHGGLIRRERLSLATVSSPSTNVMMNNVIMNSMMDGGVYYRTHTTTAP